MKEQNQPHQQFSNRQQHLRKIVVLLFACIMFGYLFSSCASKIEEPPPREKGYQPQVPEQTQQIDDMAGVDFAVFKHDSPQHKTAPCLLCHQRNDESPQIKRANHSPCIGCHVQQFEVKNEKNEAMCVICHTNKDSAELKPFPPLKSFNVQFNHQAHFKETNCATCHQSQGGGGMTIPAGGNAHANCFQCHTSEKIVADKNIGSCSTCHEAGSPNRIADTATNIGFNFNHANHSGLNCASCHNATGGGNQMSATKVAMHGGQTNSCSTCHNGGKAFGANTFNDCRQCHQEVAGIRSFGVKFNHAQHAKSDCATCHKQANKGNFTIPNGQAAHNTCYQCHSPNKDGGSFTQSKCFQCHQPGSGNDIAASTGVIAGNFSHTKHRATSCSACHSANKNGNVSAPTVAMHKASKGLNCASCHNNQKAFGGDDFSDCKRCHTDKNFKF